MDATAQLALMAKAKLVFETPGTFLNFPVLAPLSFPPSSLDFSQAAQDPAVAAALQDFSRAVNSCPVGSVSSGDGDDYLWDRYDSWLTAMTLAKSQLDPEDQAAYTAARAILMITDSNGFDADSPMVVAYKQCRDAAYAAQQAYTSAELTATSSGSSTALTTWQTVDEPRLRAAIAAAQADWANAGHKSDVESAQGTVARCQALMPQAIWAEWRKLYQPDIDCITDPATNSSYVPSAFSPSDLANQAWTTLSISGTEIATLVAGAPPELSAIFGASGTSNVTAISFEFRSASIVRPWLSTNVFQSRFWKFPDGTQLSDGASPPTGLWPAYIAAVVFVRNVQITQTNVASQPVPASQLLHLEMSRPMPSPLINRVASVVPHSSVQAAKPAAGLAKVAATPPAAAVRPEVSMRPMMFAARPALQTAHTAAPSTAAFSFLRLNSATYRTPPAASPPAVVASATTVTTTPAQTDNQITVLAFI